MVVLVNLYCLPDWTKDHVGMCEDTSRQNSLTGEDPF